MIFDTTIQKIINPDFRCVIEESKEYPIYGAVFTYDSEHTYIKELGGLKQCLESILEEVLQNPSKYTFPVSVQIFNKKTGKLIWHGKMLNK
jgi:hypothetical protein